MRGFSNEEVAVLATANLFFLLVVLFNYSVVSLLLLFATFVIMLGITLHLLYLATCQDDFQSYRGEKQAQKEKDELGDIKEEYVSAKVIVSLVIEVYRIFLDLKKQIILLVTAKDRTFTRRFCLMLFIVLPIAEYKGFMSDTFWLWIVVNSVLLSKCSP